MHSLEADQSRVGQTVGGKYLLQRLLGSGGMGSVYEAENSWTKRRVALKLLRPELAMNDEVVNRFMQEARTATQIAHPNIVDVLDMGKDPADNALYIVQEFLNGTDLRRKLDQEGRRSAQECRDLLVPIMAALVSAHDHGVVHRDIKPENIFLSRGPNGEIVPKLIDFGISKILGGESNGALQHTRAGVAMGTPQYMSPEQARGDVDLDARTDIWSLGAVIFEVLTGQAMYDAPSYELLVVKIITEDPPRIETLAPEVGAPLAGVIRRALQRDRDKRYPTMREFREALLGCTGLSAVAPGKSLDPQHTLQNVAPPPAATMAAIASRNAVAVQPTQLAASQAQSSSGTMRSTELGWSRPAEPLPSKRRWLLISGLGTAGVAAVAGLVFTLARNASQPATPAPRPVTVSAAPSPIAVPVPPPPSVAAPVAVNHPVISPLVEPAPAVAAATVVATEPVASPPSGIARRAVTPAGRAHAPAAPVAARVAPGGHSRRLLLQPIGGYPGQ